MSPYSAMEKNHLTLSLYPNDQDQYHHLMDCPLILQLCLLNMSSELFNTSLSNRGDRQADRWMDGQTVVEIRPSIQHF